MSTPTPNSRLDAVLRVIEDVVIVAGTGCGTWLTTHDVQATLTATAAVPLVRSGIASALSSGRVSGILLALKLVRQALGYIDTATIPAASLGTVTVTPVITAPPAPATDPTGV